jgi:hypothetical protein
MTTDTKKLYTLYVTPGIEASEVVVQARQWITENTLDDIVLAIEAGPETDLTGNTYDYATQFNLTTLPALVCIKQQEGSATLVCETVAAGLETILALTAEQIAALKAAHAAYVATPPAKILARRIG